MKRLLKRMLDPAEFLSEYGIRAISRYHLEHPYRLELDGAVHEVRYEPGESSTGLFGGNSNWRGPIWFPINFLIVEALQKFHHYYGDDFLVECRPARARSVRCGKSRPKSRAAWSPSSCAILTADGPYLVRSSCSNPIRTGATTCRSTSIFMATAGAAWAPAIRRAGRVSWPSFSSRPQRTPFMPRATDVERGRESVHAASLAPPGHPSHATLTLEAARPPKPRLTILEQPLVSFGPEIGADLPSALRREWLVTNGIGGYASGSVAGVNTRRYHGLLVAALAPPVERTVLVGGSIDWATYDGHRYALSTHEYGDGTIDPHGYRRCDRLRWTARCQSGRSLLVTPSWSAASGWRTDQTRPTSAYRVFAPVVHSTWRSRRW